MESRLVKVKREFNNIINIRNNVKNIFDILQVRIDKLKLFYSEFIKNSKNDMFVFGLDSFHFQSKLIDIEYDDMKRLFLAINNRMYCEYFKLHKIIVEYILKNIDDKKITDIVKVNNYPIYKDLEPYKDYKFETILDIHENILNLLNILMSNLSNKENELVIHKTKQNIGLNIDNFITSFNFNIIVLKEKISMFITYIEFFHKMHTKYLHRFSNKIQLMHTHINNDIKFDEHINGRVNSSSTDNYDVNANDNKTRYETNSESDRENNIGGLLSNNIREQIDSDTVSTTSSISISDTNNTFNTNGSSKHNSTNENIIRIRNENLGEPKRNLKEIIKNNVTKVSSMLQICKPKNTNNVISHNVSTLKTEVSNEDLKVLFSNVNTSCDSIINSDAKVITGIPESFEQKDPIGINIDVVSKENINVEMLENDITLNSFINPNKINEVLDSASELDTSNKTDSVNENNIAEIEYNSLFKTPEENVELKNEEIILENVVIEENPAPFVERVVAVEEIADIVYLSDENSLPSSYSESYTTENEQVNEHSVSETIITDAPKKKRNYKPRKKKTDN